MRFDDAPPLVIWEVSQACDLACANCRPSAAPRRHSSELSTEEGIRLLEQIRMFGNPLVVLTGGDPLKRPDLFTLIRTSVALGLRTTVRVSATPLLTKEVVERFKAAGVERIAVGLDGWNAASHDGSRGIPGAFDSAMSALRTAREIGLDTQVHTTVTGANQHLLHEIAAVLEDVNPRIWTLALAGDEREKVFRDIYALSHAVSFDVRTDDARYRNYLARRLECLGEVAEPAGDHRGFIFISHTGEIHPGGFLPVSAGNIHDDLLVNVYRDSSLFRILSDHHEFLGGQQELGQHKYSEVRGLGLML